MTPAWLTAILRCPDTHQSFTAVEGGLRRADGRLFRDLDGVPSLVYPPEVQGEDRKMNRLYERLAPFYDFSERALGRLLTGVDMQESRAQMASLVVLRPGMRFLEVSPGPGVFFPWFRQRLGPGSQYAAIDLSMAMLRECRARHASLDVELIHGNAQYLPFADESFDALFHFGGVNLFNEPTRALDEFVRVVRKGGTLAWGDEQMSARFRHPLGRHLLPRLNPGFLRTPPAVPGGLVDVRRHEVHRGLGYLYTARR